MFLQTITHRIYSKLTQRRALIRRVICNVFYEFVLETEAHNGIAEMLEILASIINGFAVPIKDEHKIMLVKALVPLHKAKAIGAYHPQLSYCMALYVAKDHALTRDILPGLLKFWPFGSFTKQIMFLNELEDIFEYVQVRIYALLFVFCFSWFFGGRLYKTHHTFSSFFLTISLSHIPSFTSHPTRRRMTW